MSDDILFNIKQLEEKNAAERYEAGLYKCLYEVWEKRASTAEAHLRDLWEALMEIRRIANGPGDRRAAIEKIYGIATKGARGASNYPIEGDTP